MGIKKISYGFHFLALVLFLGHMMVPHVHEKVQETTVAKPCHNGDKGFLGVLEHVFSINLGGDHLEEFVKHEVSKTKICPNFSLLLVSENFLYSKSQFYCNFKNGYFPSSPFFPTTNYHQSSCGLRAPPLFVV